MPPNGRLGIAENAITGFPKQGVLRIEREGNTEEVDGAQNKGLSTEKNEANSGKTIFSEARQLYLELLSFKGDSTFHKVGFTSQNKYSSWAERVGKLKEDPRSEGLLKKGIPIEDLLNPGLEYFKSGGKETAFTRFANREFRKAFGL